MPLAGAGPGAALRDRSWRPPPTASSPLPFLPLTLAPEALTPLGGGQEPLPPASLADRRRAMSAGPNPDPKSGKFCSCVPPPPLAATASAAGAATGDVTVGGAGEDTAAAPPPLERPSGGMDALAGGGCSCQCSAPPASAKPPDNCLAASPLAADSAFAAASNVVAIAGSRTERADPDSSLLLLTPLSCRGRRVAASGASPAAVDASATSSTGATVLAFALPWRSIRASSDAALCSGCAWADMVSICRGLTSTEW